MKIHKKLLPGIPLKFTISATFRKIAIRKIWVSFETKKYTTSGCAPEDENFDRHEGFQCSFVFIFVQNTWGNTLKNLSWRIDIKSQAKHIDQLNTPTAIVELQIADSQASDKVKKLQQRVLAHMLPFLFLMCTKLVVLIGILTAKVFCIHFCMKCRSHKGCHFKLKHLFK